MFFFFVGIVYCTHIFKILRHMYVCHLSICLDWAYFLCICVFNVFLFFLFFFFFLCTHFTVSKDIEHCSCIIHTLFTGLTTTLFRKKKKIYIYIYIYKWVSQYYSHILKLFCYNIFSFQFSIFNKISYI